MLIEYATCLQKYVEVHDDSSIPSWEEPGAASVLGRALTCLSTLSVLNEQLVFRQNYANGGMGRANEYLRQITTNFEQICSIKRYQSTPRRLGALTYVMVHIAPALLAPYWRHFCSDFDHGKGISPKGVCVPAYLACTLFCVILSTMYSGARRRSATRASHRSAAARTAACIVVRKYRVPRGAQWRWTLRIRGMVWVRTIFTSS